MATNVSGNWAWFIALLSPSQFMLENIFSSKLENIVLKGRDGKPCLEILDTDILASLNMMHFKSSRT
jgi:hypothetical protein